MDEQFDPLTLAYHELRSALGVVVMQARAVADETAEPETQRRCDGIARVGEQLLRTAAVVLAAAGTSGDQPRLFAPAGTAAQLIDGLQALDVPVTLAVSQAARQARTTGNAGTFEALLHTLISNAMDHSTAGTRIDVHLDATPGRLALSVTNAAGDGTSHRGLGAGTYIAARLAESLGATLEARREDGEYAVCVRMPAQLDQRQPGHAAPLSADEHVPEPADGAQQPGVAA